MDPITRRDFLKAAASCAAAAATGLGAGLPIVGAAGPPEDVTTGLIPAEKGISPEALAALRARGERRVYRGRARYAIGMPVGGICAGQLYLLGDGTLGGWRVDGRAHGSGGDYRTRRPERELEQGFRIEAGGKAAVLADAEHGGSYDAVEFVGEYPLAEVRYRASAGRAAALPQVEVTLRAYSPFAPLEAKESALPATVLRFLLRNLAAEKVEGRLAGWLENGVARGDAEAPPLVLHANAAREGRGVTSILFGARARPSPANPRPERILWDFNGGGYEGWEVEGAAFGAAPAAGTLPGQNPVTGFEGKGLVNSFLGGDAAVGRMRSAPFPLDRRYLTFLVGGGAWKGATCVNLLLGGKVVRTATGRNDERLEPRAWDVADLAGCEARLEIVDAATGPWGHVSPDRFALADALPPAWNGPAQDGLTTGTVALAVLGGGDALPAWNPGDPLPEARPGPADAAAEKPLVGLISVPFALEPGASREIVFLVAWHFPNRETGQGTRYANDFADALDVAAHLAANDARLHERTELFRKTFYDDTTLPPWLAARVMAPVANLASGTCEWWKNGRFWAWEGVGCCHGTCTHVWNYAQGEARLFPELARSVRLMQDLGTAFDAASGRVAFRGDARGGYDYAADGQAGTILKCYREHRACKDDSFLRESWPRVRLALEYLVAKDAEGGAEPQGVIEGAQPNTYDIDFFGANTFVGSLYLAALAAGAALAERAGDPAAARRYRAIAARGRAWTEKSLWNGEYFEQRIPRGAATRWQYGRGCLADQLFGETWARLLDLPPVYDEALVRRALASIYRYNWAPAVGPYGDRYPPGRAFAQGREAGLFLCTWPRSGRPEEPVAYRDEVWTGIEYQVATCMIAAGLVDEGLVLVKAIDDRYDGALHNPWNEIECGEHYARALASFGVLQAVSGFACDGPAGTWTMAPRMQAEDFAAFFAGPEGWGRLVQRRGRGEQVNRLEVRAGAVRVAELRVELPEEARAARLEGAAEGAVEGRRAIARFAPARTAGPGEHVEVRWRWS